MARHGVRRPDAHQRRFGAPADVGGLGATGVKAAPAGGSMGLGTSPSSVILWRSAFLRGSGMGTAESRAVV
jgi:hypothetical protein